MEVALLALLAPAFAQTPAAPEKLRFEVKGHYIGQVLEPAYCVNKGAAGLRTTYPTIGGEEVKLDWIEAACTITTMRATFAAGSWASIRDAVRTKYPMVKCATSSVQNGLGATFEQETCTATDELGSELMLMRYGEDLTQGVLAVVSKADADKAKQAVDAKNHDL